MIRDNRKSIIIFLTLLFIVTLIPITVNANVVPKIELTIDVKTFEHEPYFLDLLVKEKDYIYFNHNTDILNKDYPTSYKEMPIYKYSEDGWYAAHIRTKLLDGSLHSRYSWGNYMVHRFGYLGVPKNFKIIFQKNNGELIISDEVTTNQFFSHIIYDAEKNEVTVISDRVQNDMDSFYTGLFITIIIELLIAMIFGIKQLRTGILFAYKVVIITNIITQICLYFIFISIFDTALSNYMLHVLIILEFLIIVLETLIYKKYLDNISLKRIFTYTVVANIISMLVGNLWSYFLI